MQNIIFFLRFFEQWNGIFVRKNTINQGLKPLYETMMAQRFFGLSNDKKSLNSDYQKIKQDFRKSLQSYKNG